MAEYTAERRAEAATRHGMSDTRIYRIWAGMLSRCRNPNDTCYGRYGGSGVLVCAEWSDFETFFADMGGTYEHGLTIDRIDSGKGYSPDNCRWVEASKQSGNRRSNIFGYINGEKLTLTQAISLHGKVSYDTAKARIRKLGWDFEKAVTLPV